MASIEVSRLRLTRLTNLQFDEIIDEKDEEQRKKKLIPVMDQMKRFTDTMEMEEIRDTVEADRVLLKTAHTYVNVLMGYNMAILSYLFFSLYAYVSCYHIEGSYRVVHWRANVGLLLSYPTIHNITSITLIY